MNSKIKTLAALIAFAAPMLAVSHASADLGVFSNPDVQAAASCAGLAATGEHPVSNDCQVAADAACVVESATLSGDVLTYDVDCDFTSCLSDCAWFDIECGLACAANPLADVQAACEAHLSADGDLSCGGEYAGAVTPTQNSALPRPIMRLDLAGRDLTDYMRKILTKGEIIDP